MSEILRVSKEDFVCTRELYEEVFPEDSKDFVDYYYREKSADSEGLIIKHACDESVISMIHCNPYEVLLPTGQRSDYVWETTCKTVFYIVAVGTKEEQRKKGFMRELMNKALLSSYEKNHPFLFLMPVSEALYAPYGFTYIYNKINWRINDNIITGEILKMLQEKRKPILLLNKGQQKLWISALGTEYLRQEIVLEESVRELRAASNIEKSDIEQLVAFATDELQNSKNVYVNRTNAYYLHLQMELQSQGGDIYLLWEGRHLVGYFIYTKEAKGIVQEMIIRDDTYQDALVVKNKNTPVIMARIVNLASMGEHIFCDEEPFCLTVRISDSIIVENNGLFLWEIEKKGSTFLRIEQEGSDGIILDTSIDLLTAFCFGYKNPDECFREINACGQIPIKKELQKKLQALRRPNAPFFNEVV